jgi:hypothetical protein
MATIHDEQGIAFGYSNPVPTLPAGNTLVEQKTQTDAVTGSVTFSKTIQYIEIYNTDATNQGVFNVNGINITVPSKESFKAKIGGVLSAVVSVTGATSYILTRYE